MGPHHFSGAPQLGRSQGCRLMELDEWTVTRTEQVDPPLPPPRPPLTKITHECERTDTHSQMQTCTRTAAHTHHPQRRVCTAARWNMAKRRPIILQTDDSGCGRPDHFSCRGSKPCCCRLLTTGLLLQPSVYGTVHFKETLTTSAICGRMREQDYQNVSPLLPS